MTSYSLFKYKISGSQTFILGFLVLVLIGLAERLLYDLSRTIIGSTYSYTNDPSTLLLHAVFAIVVIAVAVIINVAVAGRKEKYAIVLIPYFVTAIALGLQVAIEGAIYFTNHHTQLQFYLVMTSLVLITSLLIYFIQKRFILPEPVVVTASGIKRIVIGIVVGVLLLLPVFYLIFFFFLRSRVVF